MALRKVDKMIWAAENNNRGSKIGIITRLVLRLILVDV